MGLNKSKGNMYEFVTDTWNAIKGKCPHDCTYCYMKRWGNLNPIRLDEKELRTDLGSGKFIFVGSSCDMFADDINPNWIIKALQHCEEHDNKYLLQTKNPKALNDYAVNIAAIKEFALCITLETNRHYPEVMKNSPTPNDRATEFASIPYNKKYITIEPIMDFDLQEIVELIERCDPLQVNIGADTGGNNLPEPSKEKVSLLIYELSKFTKIENKRNLKRLIK